jgi:hypothetical protein
MSALSMVKFRAILFAVILTVAPLSLASQAEDLEGAVVVNVPFAREKPVTLPVCFQSGRRLKSLRTGAHPQAWW